MIDDNISIQNRLHSYFKREKFFRICEKETISDIYKNFSSHNLGEHEIEMIEVINNGIRK